MERIAPELRPASQQTTFNEDDAAEPERSARRLLGLSTPTGVIPNDPRFRQSWYAGRIGLTNAWATTTGSTNVVVAVLDTGINYRHEDLAANMWRNPGETGTDAGGRDRAENGIDDDDNGFVDDVFGIDTASDTLGRDSDPLDEGVLSDGERIYHGTLCAGLIGAVGNNGKGVAGINWSIQLMAIRVGTTNNLDWISDVVAGFDYVVTMKRRGVNIRVTSNSYGADPLSGYSQALKDVIDAAGREGVLQVFASGNHGLDIDAVPLFPNRYDSPSLLAVAASDRSDQLASFSNHGRSGVDLAAPGVDITSTYGPAANRYTDGFWGTSLSCPLVAGAAALLLSVNPELTVDQLKAALFGSVDQPSGLKGKVVTHGRMNVARALEYLTNANPSAIVITALPRGLRTTLKEAIQVTFNRPMDRSSVEGALVIEPPVIGTFEWTDNSQAFLFHHEAPFNGATNYTVRILGSARDHRGEGLDGNFNRIHEGSGKDDFSWTFRFPIPNDDFANAQWLSGPMGSTIANNRNASIEVGEPFHAASEDPGHGRTLWYRWAAPEVGGWSTFDLSNGTPFDSLLFLYTGDRMDQLVEVAGNDNYGNRASSRVSFAVTAQTNYWVAVASKSAIDPDQAGNFRLSWYPTPPPGFTGSQFAPSEAIPGSKVTLTGTNFTGATSVLFHGASASFVASLTNNLDLRITATVPPDALSGPITIVTPHGNVTSTVTFRVFPPKLSIRLIRERLVELTWPATSPAIALQYSDELGGGRWSAVPAPPVVTADGVSRYAVDFDDIFGTRFYRLKAGN